MQIKMPPPTVSAIAATEPGTWRPSAQVAKSVTIVTQPNEATDRELRKADRSGCAGGDEAAPEVQTSTAVDISTERPALPERLATIVAIEAQTLDLAQAGRPQNVTKW